MKTANRLAIIALVTVLVGLTAAAGYAKKEATPVVHTISTMAAQVGQLEGQEITVTGTVVGVCASGCKMWIAEGQYKEGDLFTLVRAKDDSFKFDTKKSGAKVQLSGFVVAKYKDYCGDAAAEGKPEPKAGETAGSCAAPVKVDTATKGELEEMTFFATNVTYVE